MRTDEPSQLPRSLATRCTRLLISVRDADEVEAAIGGGADWIDLKEPNAGALGAVSADIAREIIERVAGRRRVSAALGEWRDWDDTAARELLDFAEIEVVKLGLAGYRRVGNWQAQWQEVAKTISESGHELAAVAYADWQEAAAPVPRDIISCAADAGSRYFLLDTFDKKSGGLFNHVTVSELSDILRFAKEASLATVVAGSLQHADLALELLTGADIIGVRGGVCGGDRTTKVDRQLVADFHAAMSQ